MLMTSEKAGTPITIRGSECNCFYYIKDVEFPTGVPVTPDGFEYNLYSPEACVPGQPGECNKFSWVFNSHLPDCSPSGFPGCFDIGTQFGTFQANKPFNCTVSPFSSNLPVSGLCVALADDCLDTSGTFEWPTVTFNISCSNFINKGCDKETSYQSQDVIIDLGNDYSDYFKTALCNLGGECGCTPIFTGLIQG